MARLSFEDEMFIIGLYNSGVRYMTELCAKSNCSDDTVRRTLKKYGCRVIRTYTKITPYIVSKAKQLRAEGKTYREIAVALNVGCSTVKRLVQDEDEHDTQKIDNQQPQQSEQQMQLPICKEIKATPIEALRMLRDALDMIINAREEP